MRTATRIARIGAIVLFALVSVACTPRIVYRIKTVEVPVLRIETPPSSLIADTHRPTAPPPQCSVGEARVLCNGQLEATCSAYADALAACNADKAALRAWEAERKRKPP